MPLSNKRLLYGLRCEGEGRSSQGILSCSVLGYYRQCEALSFSSYKLSTGNSLADSYSFQIILTRYLKISGKKILSFLIFELDLQYWDLGRENALIAFC